MQERTNPGDDPAEKKRILDLSVEIAVRLGVVAVLVVWCFHIFRPFLIPVVTGMIIAVAIDSPFQRLLRLVGGRRGLAATIFALAAIGLTVMPAFRVTDSIVESTLGLADQVQTGELDVPAPNESLRGWPIVGGRLYEAWALAHDDLQAAVERFSPQLRTMGTWVLGKIRGLAGAILHLILALIIAGIMLAYAPGGVSASQGVLARLGGERGGAMVGLIAATIRSVAVGVLGIAAIQAGLVGLGFFLVGLPGWGLWTLAIFFIGILQLPALLLTIPAIAYVFSTGDSTVVSVVFAVWSLLAGTSDAILKPMLLGRGLDVPMPVILLGAIGGMVVYGLIGLFIGAVVLAVGHELFMAWLRAELSERDGEAESAAEAPAST